MKSFIKIFEILGKWRYQYLSAAFLLIASVGFRLLEPKVLQLAVDKIITFFISKGTKPTAPGDVVSGFLYSFLPELKIEMLV